MLWIFPIAGKGSRTQKLGEFKPFIKIGDLTILTWFLNSIKNKIKNQDNLLFITTEYFEEKFSVEKEISIILNNLKINNNFRLFKLKEIGQGPSVTVHNARNHILNSKEPVIVINSDQYIDFKMPEDVNQKTGFLPVYAEFSNKSSYVKLENNLITRIVEKNNISNLASAGVYILSDGECLIQAIEEQFKKKQLTNNEYYIGPALNNLIREGYNFYPLEVYFKYDLGNIDSINYFKNRFNGKE